MNTPFPSFAEFFREVHGYQPFGWQRDLAQQVQQSGVFPDLIDLPTGAGKTTVIDVALFAMAHDAATRPAAERRIPRRIVYVVDRRIIVDQVNAHGQRLIHQLRTGSSSAIEQVRTALKSLSAPIDPSDDAAWLHTAQLRGGLVRDERWAQRPDVPALITSTVDQVGSRLLFRGYGISPKSAPIHAGLLSADCLFILDEVHLARPFSETLQAVKSLRRPVGDGSAAGDGEVIDVSAGSAGVSTATSGTKASSPFDRWAVVELSATPPTGTYQRFPAQPLTADSVPDTDRAVLAPRLLAHKPARLVAAAVAAAKTRPEKHDADFAKVAIAELVSHLKSDQAPQLVGIVVNRVSTAVAIARTLLDGGFTGSKAIGPVDVRLITGRMRPYDRDRLFTGRLDAWTDRAARLSGGSDWGADSDVGARSDTPARPEIIVATQCIEAGADLDLDCLITECASADALRQRFGRVDRRGALHASGGIAGGSVILRGTKPDETDPVYGTAMAATWNWLQQLAALDDNGTVDFGIEYLPQPGPDTFSPSQHAPRLTSVHMDILAQTFPRPAVDLSVSLWLHGQQDESADVQVVWRADLTAAGVNHNVGDEHPAIRQVQVLPPRDREAVSVPIAAVRAWLRGQDGPAVSDADSRAPEDSNERYDATAGRACVRWRGEGDVQVVSPHRTRGTLDLRPGDTIVVPAEYGGLALGSWSPTSTSPIDDVATEVHVDATDRVTLRLSPGLFDDSVRHGNMDADAPRPPSIPTGGQLHHDHSLTAAELVEEYLVEWLHFEQTRAAAPANRLRMVEHLLAKPARWSVSTLETGEPGARSYFVVQSNEPFARRAHRISAERTGADIDTSADLDGSSFTAPVMPARLDRHLWGVGEIAYEFGRAIGLSDELCRDLQLAGTLHDLGKADPRFQRMLGNLATPHRDDGPTDPANLLAKSPSVSTTIWARRAAAKAAGYPTGQRHEVQSLALIDSNDACLAAATNPQLVRHLVTSHHGRSRPLPQRESDRSPATISLQTVDGHIVSASTAHGLAAIDNPQTQAYQSLAGRFGHHGVAALEAILRLADQTRSAFEQQGIAS